MPYGKLTDYERYQLEWMIAHGYSLYDLSNSIEDVVDNDRLVNGGVPGAYEFWLEHGNGFDGAIFSNEREFTTEDLPAMGAEDRQVDYRRALADALRNNGYGVETDGLDRELTLSMKDERTGALVAATITADGNPDDPHTWMEALRGLGDVRRVSVNGRVPYRGDDDYEDAVNTANRFSAAARTSLPCLFEQALVDAMHRDGVVTVREWYTHAHPEDHLGPDIDPLLTFEEVRNVIGEGDGLYTALGVRDTVVREHVIEGLAGHFGYDVEDVRRCWAKGLPLVGHDVCDALTLDGASFYNPETGDLIVSFLKDHDGLGSIGVYRMTPDNLLGLAARCEADAPVDSSAPLHDLIPDDVLRTGSRFHSTPDLWASGILDKGELLDVSDLQKLTEAANAAAPSAGELKGKQYILMVLEQNGALYNPESHIAIVSYLEEEIRPGIEVFFYNPYELASLVSAMEGALKQRGENVDMQTIFDDMGRPRTLDHDLAKFKTIGELMESRYSPFPDPGKWLDIGGEYGLKKAIEGFGIQRTDNVREWYTHAFPSDDLGPEINPHLTFDDALAAVPTGNGFYDSIVVGDSVVRERVFEELCNRYGYSYDEVYDSWLHDKPLPEREGHDTARTDGLDLDAEARDMRGVADGLATRQPEAPEHTERGC